MALDARALREAEAAVFPALDDAGSASPHQTAAAAVNGGDDRRMKQELVAWAKAVASMVVRGSMHC
nr:unnamed protein product [Digitaria exilis]